MSHQTTQHYSAQPGAATTRFGRFVRRLLRPLARKLFLWSIHDEQCAVGTGVRGDAVMLTAAGLFFYLPAPLAEAVGEGLLDCVDAVAKNQRSRMLDLAGTPNTN